MDDLFENKFNKIALSGGGGRSSGGWAGYPPSSPSSAGKKINGTLLLKLITIFMYSYTVGDYEKSWQIGGYFSRNGITIYFHYTGRL